MLILYLLIKIMIFFHETLEVVLKLIWKNVENSQDVFFFLKQVVGTCFSQYQDSL